MSKKSVKIVSSIAVAVILVFLFLRFLRTMVPWKFMDMYHVSLCQYVELDSKEVLPQLEKEFDITFPNNLGEVKTAANGGSWDSRDSEFLIKFIADSNTVNKFLESVHEKVDWDIYRTDDDPRGRAAYKRFFPPPWFTTPISQGRKGHFERVFQGHWYGTLTVYIDTADQSNNVVYIKGSCFLGEELLTKVKNKQTAP